MVIYVNAQFVEKEIIRRDDVEISRPGHQVGTTEAAFRYHVRIQRQKSSVTRSGYFCNNFS